MDDERKQELKEEYFVMIDKQIDNVEQKIKEYRDEIKDLNGVKRGLLKAKENINKI